MSTSSLRQSEGPALSPARRSLRKRRDDLSAPRILGPRPTRLLQALTPPIVLSPPFESQSHSPANRQQVAILPSGSAESVGSLGRPTGLALPLWSHYVH